VFLFGPGVSLKIFLLAIVPFHKYEKNYLYIGDAFVNRSGALDIYSNSVIKSITATDSSVSIGTEFYNTTFAIIKTLTVLADRKELSDALAFNAKGKNAGDRGTHDNIVNSLTVGQTAAARASGYAVVNPVTWYASLGDKNIVQSISGTARRQPYSRNPASVVDLSPIFPSITIARPS
jgi:hypothetical protein